MVKLNKSKGFTLMELLVALAIVGTILLAFFKTIDSTNKMNAKNDRDIKAINILQSEIENLRKQIKTTASNQERKLEIYDDLSSSTNFLEFQEDKAEIIYTRKYKQTNISYKINLVVDRELISADEDNNHIESKDVNFNDYMYTLNISAVLEDKYFSKKESKINNVKILANNTKLSEEEVVGGEKPTIIPNRTIGHGNHQVIISSSGNFRNNLQLKSNLASFLEYKGTHLEDHTNQLNPPPDNSWGCVDKNMLDYEKQFKCQGMRMKLQYKKDYSVMKLDIEDKITGEVIEIFYGNEYWSCFKHKNLKKIGIEVENAGVILKNLYINGIYIGDVDRNTIYEFENEIEEVTLVFDGFEIGTYPNQDADNTKVYIEFSE